MLGMICVFVLTGSGSKEQGSNVWKHEITYRHDNDAFLMQGKDGYYTAGTFISYRWRNQSAGRPVLQGLTLGHQIFTTRERYKIGTGYVTFDRPYCGYLFLEYQRLKFPDAHTMLGWGLNLGLVGDWSQASLLQLWFHHAFGLYFYDFWKGQIPNEVGLDLKLQYRKMLKMPAKGTAGFALMAGGDAKLGTFFLQAEPSVCLAYGKINELSSSSLVNARVGAAADKGRKRELYLFVEPHLVFQGYNVTVQGGRFNEPDLGANWDSIMQVKYVAASLPTALMFECQAGWALATRRITLKMIYVFQTPEARSQQRSQRFGSFQLSYRFL
jgi:hypothetical protein